MSDLGFLTLGYGLIWALIGGYVWFISHRQAGLRRQVDDLRAEVNEAAEKVAREQ
jgi:CcmD family protein